jgi:hypothetical protein
MPTRTEMDPHYREVNRNCARRINFWHKAAWAWVQANHPDIAVQIREEAKRQWPTVLRDRSPVDLDFLKVETINERK